MTGKGESMSDQSFAAESVDLTIDGMSCGACIARIESALMELTGIEQVDVSLGKASIIYIPGVISTSTFKKTIEENGYRIPQKKGKRFLDRLIDSNKKTFGSERPDCCTLNQKKK